MADFVTTNAVPQVRAPETRVSPAQVAQPYQELANNLDKAGEGLSKDVAEPLAHQAGLKAVQIGADGNITVDRPPVVGDAAVAWARGMKFGAVAQGEGEMRRQEIALREQYRDDPQGYWKAASEFRQEMIKKYTDAAGPEVGVTMGKLADATITQSFRGLLNEKEHLDLQRFEKQHDAGIASARDDLVAMARGGVTSGSEWDAKLDKIRTLTDEKVNNPRMAYPRDKADLDLQQLQGDLRANGFLYHVDQVYKDQQLNVIDRRDKALDYAKSILTDQSLKLTEAQRQHYYHTAVAEIHANEGIRRQDIFEVAQAERELRASWALGIPSTAEDVNNVGSAYERLGAYDKAASLYAYAGRKALLDTQGKRTFEERTGDLNILKNRGAAEGAYQFFVGKGYSPAAAAGIVGNLIHESGLDPTVTHDRGIGLGIAGWNRERLDDLRTFAAQRGKSPTDLQTQLEFVDQELHGKEGATLTKLMGARTAAEAATAFVDYERPLGWQPGSPTTAHGYLNRVALARQVASFAGTEGGPTPAALGQVSPAQALWEQTHAATSLQKDARNTWVGVMKEWSGKDHVVPSDEAVQQVLNAARATGDHDLLAQVALDYSRISAVKESAQQPAAVRATEIARNREVAAAGVLGPGQAGIMTDLEEQNRRITEGMKTDPIATTRARFPGRFADPGPLDMTNDGNMIAGLQQRNKIAAFGEQREDAGPVQALDHADLAQVKGALDHADPATKARIYSNLAAGLTNERVRNATLAELGKDGGERMAEVYAGSLLPVDRDVAQGIFNGQTAIKVDKRYDPVKEGPGAELNFATDMDKYLPPNTFSERDRSDPAGAYATLRNSTRYLYADASQRANDTSGRLDTSRLQKAVNDVTGGVLDFNGGKIIAPRRGMPQTNFDGMMSTLTDNDLAGVQTLSGNAVTADHLRRSGKLETIGDGRYLIRFGDNPGAYAWTKPEMGAPRPFVLDLGRRNAPPMQYPSPTFSGG